MRARISPKAARSSFALLSTEARPLRACVVAQWLSARGLAQQEAVPLRKHLKAEAKRRKAEARQSEHVGSKRVSDPRADRWELTVGIEIHAELNTACKLFSPAAASSADGVAIPNTLVAPFDAALPGTQPRFQTATLLPALRAAIALGCQIQRTSGWDRKHYFHWDQPNGYQITQYYRPFALDGELVLTADDGVPAADLHGAATLRIGIKQVQMEQDTAKTTLHGASTYHIDLNRAGHPLIEIITLPHIHSPQTAAAVVRKIQAILKSVDACATGMELGGLRADVNVSVRERGIDGAGSAYGGVSGLGQRTEIKNLSSFAAVEKAIGAERDRQIALLESGGVVLGETRGWSLGATETTRLRGKEGEVDYRYMPDADLPPLVIGDDLVQHLRSNLPELPDATVQRVQHEYGLSAKDARILVALDDGDRLEYLEETVEHLRGQLPPADTAKAGKVAGNWVLHELGGLLTTDDGAWADLAVSPQELSDLVAAVLQRHITGPAAKQLLATLYRLPAAEAAPRPSVQQLIDEGDLRLRPLTDEGYEALVRAVMDENPEMVAAVRDKGQKGKAMWFVGQVVRRGDEGTVEPERAREVVTRLLGV